MAFLILEIEVFGILIILWKCHSWTESSLFCLWVEKVRPISHFVWCCTILNFSIRK